MNTMKMPVLVMAVVLSLAAALNACPEKKGNQAKVSPLAAQAWGAVQEGFQLSAKLEKATVRPGEPVVLVLALRNVTDTTLKLDESRPDLDYDLTLLDSSGKPAALTPSGKKRQGAKMFWWRSTREVRPGEVIEWKVVVSDLYDLSAPGTYRITASREVRTLKAPGRAKVRSNEATLTMTDPGKDPKPPNIFYKAVPKDLTTRTDNLVQSLSKKYPLASPAASEISTAVKDLDLKFASRNTALRAKIRCAGPGAIPVIAGMLLSRDDEVRRKALHAVMVFRLPREHITSSYAEIESVLLALAGRALLDRNPDVRGNAVAALAAMGQERFPKIPEAVKVGLAEVMRNDPDPDVRKLADYSLQDLGVIPRDPNRTGIVN